MATIRYFYSDLLIIFGEPIESTIFSSRFKLKLKARPILTRFVTACIANKLAIGRNVAFAIIFVSSHQSFLSSWWSNHNIVQFHCFWVETWGNQHYCWRSRRDGCRRSSGTRGWCRLPTCATRRRLTTWCCYIVFTTIFVSSCIIFSWVLDESITMVFSFSVVGGY